jgi:hypothetical protein
LAGELCNSTQERLAAIEQYTGLYKSRIQAKTKPSNHSNGDFCDNPLCAIRMLKNNSYSNLNIRGRSGDFRSEVEWRLQLRPQFN